MVEGKLGHLAIRVLHDRSPKGLKRIASEISTRPDMKQWTYIPESTQATTALQKLQTNICEQIDPGRAPGRCLKYAHELSKRPRKQNIDNSANDQQDDAQTLRDIRKLQLFREIFEAYDKEFKASALRRPEVRSEAANAPANLIPGRVQGNIRLLVRLRMIKSQRFRALSRDEYAHLILTMRGNRSVSPSRCT